MPTVTTSRVIPLRSWYDMVHYVNGVVNSTQTNVTMSNTFQLKEELSKNSINTPGYAAMLAEGRRWNLPINSFEKIWWHSTYPGGNHVETHFYAPSNRYVYQVYQNSLANISEIAFDANTIADDPIPRAVSKLIEQISTSKANAAVSAAEFGKTMAHVAHTATRLAGALTALKHGRLGDMAASLGLTTSRVRVERFNKRFGKLSKDTYWKSSSKYSRRRNESRMTDFLADTWLEYSYGWKPLLQDTFDLAEATAEIMIERQKVWRKQTTRAQNAKSFKKSSSDTYWDLKSTIVSQTYAEVGVEYAIPDGSVSIADAFGLTNPATVAWELVPFSFVADWFLPIGDYLSSFTAYSGLTFKKGFISERHVWTCTREMIWKRKDLGGGSYIDFGGAQLKDTKTLVHIKRTPLLTFPSIGFPKFNDPRSFAHGASAIALLQSLFLRK